MEKKDIKYYSDLQIVVSFLKFYYPKTYDVFLSKKSSIIDLFQKKNGIVFTNMYTLLYRCSVKKPDSIITNYYKNILENYQGYDVYFERCIKNIIIG